MAAGFRCSDGIVLFADTELTYPESLKYSGSTKVRVYQDPASDISVALTGAGDWEYLSMAFERIIRILPTAGDNVDGILDKIEEIVLQIFETNVALSPVTPKPGFDLFAAVRTRDGSLGLMKSSDVSFQRQFSIEMSGVGKLLGLYLADLLYKPRITVQHGLFVAAYILRVAKKYVSGVGGRSDIVTLSDTWGLSTAFGTDITLLQNHFDEFDAVLSPLIVALPHVVNRDSPPEEELDLRIEFDSKLQQFVNRVNELRQSFENEKSPFWGL